MSGGITGGSTLPLFGTALCLTSPGCPFTQLRRLLSVVHCAGERHVAHRLPTSHPRAVMGPQVPGRRGDARLGVAECLVRCRVPGCVSSWRLPRVHAFVSLIPGRTCPADPFALLPCSGRFVGNFSAFVLDTVRPVVTVHGRNNGSIAVDSTLPFCCVMESTTPLCAGPLVLHAAWPLRRHRPCPWLPLSLPPFVFTLTCTVPPPPHQPQP